MLWALKKAGLTVKKQKCIWGVSQQAYLDYKVGDGKISIHEARVMSVQEWKKPVTVKQQGSSLGTLGFYRIIIPNMAEHSNIVTAATRKGCPMTVNG